jgi:hypothetical protein
MVRITFIPTIEEHLAGRRALARVAPVFDPTGALPRLIAILLLSNLLVAVFEGGGSGWAVLWPLGVATFFTGVGIRMRRGRGRSVTYELTDDAIHAVQPRHRWRVPREEVRRWEQTDAFIVVVTRRFAFYLPRRALGDADGEAAVRAWLAASMEG